MKTNLLSRIVAVALPLICTPAWAATTVGSLSNFDAINDTGGETEGFEIELEGIHSSDIYGTFGAPYNRYGNPITEDTPSGVIVRWTAKWDPVSMTYDTATPLAPANINPGGHDCYNGGPIGNYLTSGCEHFGISLGKAQTATTYRWLVADPNNPGQLQSGGNVPIPAPRFAVDPNPVPGRPPVVQAVVEAPREEGEHREYADAYWVKLIKTEVHSDDPIQLDQLVLGRHDDPDNMGLFHFEDQDQEVETEWVIVQNRLNGGPGENELAQEMKADGNDNAVAFRFEVYEYTGPYDPENHEVMCGGDGGCDAPLNGELGGYLGAQMAGVNLGLPPGLPGDFDGNGALDPLDIDDLTLQSAGGQNPAAYDLNADSLVNTDDVTAWIKDLYGSWVGDANLDNEFNSGDLVQVLASGLYEVDADSTWSSGDFNGDGRTNTTDLVAALADGGYELGPPAAAAVPEPTSFGWLPLIVVAALRKRRANRVA